LKTPKKQALRRAELAYLSASFAVERNANLPANLPSKRGKKKGPRLLKHAVLAPQVFGMRERPGWVVEHQTCCALQRELKQAKLRLDRLQTQRLGKIMSVPG